MIRFAPHAVLGVLLAAALATGAGVSPARAQSATTSAPNGGTSSYSSAPNAAGTTHSRSKRHRKASNSAATSTTGTSSAAAASTSSHATPSGRGQFSTEAAARRSCPSDTVVWGNSGSKTLHLSGDRYYGKTKHGAFMCQRQAMQAGYHVAGHGAVGAKKTKTSSSK